MTEAVIQTDDTIKISSALSEKAMVARLATSSWSGRITDKEVSKELTDGKNAARDFASVTKVLIDKNHLKNIREVISKMRAYHKEQTLPWDNYSGGLLPSTKFNEYSAKIREARRDLEAAVAVFVTNYENYITESEQKLGDLFCRNDYPSVHEIPNKFNLEASFEKVPEAGDFRVDIPEHEQAKVRSAIESKVEHQHANAMKRVWTRIFKTVEHINERLSQEDGIFRDSMIENLEQLVNVLPALNILEDPTLTEMTNELQNTLCGYSAKELRKNTGLRKELAEKSKEVMEKINKIGNLFGSQELPPEVQAHQALEKAITTDTNSEPETNVMTETNVEPIENIASKDILEESSESV